MEQTKHSISDSWDFLVPTVWNLNVWISVIRGFGTNCLKSECSDFNQLVPNPQMTEIQTFGFQTIGTKSPNDWNPNVRIPNSIALVPNVRNPNKTIPNSWSFGFQHCLKSERSVFGRWLYTNNFKIRILRKSGDLQISSWSLIKINYYILLVGTENIFKNPYPLPPPFYKLALNHNYRLIVTA